MEQRAPERIYGWLDTQLSIARHYGGCKYNGAAVHPRRAEAAKQDRRIPHPHQQGHAAMTIRFKLPTLPTIGGNPTPYHPVVCLKCKSIQWEISLGVSYHCGARTVELNPAERLYLADALAQQATK